MCLKVCQHLTLKIKISTLESDFQTARLKPIICDDKPAKEASINNHISSFSLQGPVRLSDGIWVFEGHTKTECLRDGSWRTEGRRARHNRNKQDNWRSDWARICFTGSDGAGPSDMWMPAEHHGWNTVKEDGRGSEGWNEMKIKGRKWNPGLTRLWLSFPRSLFTFPRPPLCILNPRRTFYPPLWCLPPVAQGGRCL